MSDAARRTDAANAAVWHLKIDDRTVFGPVPLDALVSWAMDGRVLPGQMVSNDGTSWMPAEALPALEMHWTVRLPDGSHFGPVNIRALSEAVSSGSIRPEAELKDGNSGKTTTVGARRSEILGLVAAKHAPSPAPAGRPDNAQQKTSREEERETEALRAQPEDLAATAPQTESLLAQVAQLKAAAASARAEKEKIERSLDELRAQTDSLRLEAAKAQALSARTAALEKQVKDFEISAGKQRRETEHALEATRATREKASAELAEAHAAILALKKSNADVSAELSTAKASLSASQSMLSDAVMRADDLGRELALARESESRLKTSVASGEEKIDDLSRALEHATKQATDMKAEMALLATPDSDTDIDWISGKRTLKEGAERKKAAGLVSKLRDDLNKRDDEIRALKKDIEIVREEARKAAGMNQSGAEKQSEIERLKAESSRQIGLLQQELAQAKKMASEAIQAKSDMARDRASAEAGTRTLDSKLRTPDSGIAATAPSSHELSALRDELALARAEMQSAQIRNRTQTALLKEMVRSLEESAVRMTNALDHERKLRVQESRKTARLQRELAELKESPEDKPAELPAQDDASRAHTESALLAIEEQAQRELQVWQKSRVAGNPPAHGTGEKRR
ncbi:MAG: hypothetical protein FJ224_02910 [Lentisphaerae bacterium]|nr:hypothetical protein [Lentisphaerota bacterium]